MSWGLGQAVVGHNRRAVYRSGESVMYGDTSRDDFIGIEGFEDPGVPMLFFWNDREELNGVVINLAAPSQETEGLSEASADFWHEVRQEVRERHQPGWFIFEFYLEYSIRIQARSPAVLTFTVQLASQLAGYLPTTEAVAGGGYSTNKFLVGPEGGDVLVEEVLKAIHSLFR